MNLLKSLFGVKNLSSQGEAVREGDFYKSYLKIAWPAALEGIFINMIILADLTMVGSLGVRAWAAVGIVSQPKMIMLICSRSLGVALTAFVARRKGEDKRRDFLSGFKQSLILNFIVYSILLTLVLLFNKNILLFAGAKTEYIELAQTYFKYIAIGIFFRSMGIMISSAKVGLGKTKEVFYANVVGNVVNVILNYILIFGNFGFPMLGIKGAAIATMIGDISTFLILLAGVINPENELNLSKEGSWKMEKHIMSPILNITSGTLAEQVFERIGLFLFSRIIAELGTVATGTNYVAMILCDLCYYTAIGMGVASSAFTGQKLGEKRPDLAKIYGKVASNVGYIVSTFFAVIFILFRKELFMVMIQDPDVIHLGSFILIFVAIACFPQVQALVNSGVLRGAGDSKYVALYSLVSITVIRPIVTYMLAFTFGFGAYGVWLALILDQTMRMIISKKRILSDKWIKKVV